MSSQSEQVIRTQVAHAKRVVVKVGSSSLSSAEAGIDEAKISALVTTLATLHNHGREVVLISSGAISAGLNPLRLKTRPKDLAHQQAAAAVGQGLLIRRYTELFAEHDIAVGQVLLTIDDVTRRSSYVNGLRTLGTLLQLGAIPIINENDTVAIQEIRFGDNDRLAALVAQLVRADALVLLSDVNGVYTSHPDDPDSRHITFVPNVEQLHVDTRHRGSAIGSGGMTTKLQAAQIAASSGIPVLLTRACDAAEALTTGATGTAFSPIDKRRPRRLLWLAHASVACGRLHVDAGAVRALVQRGASLLPAGITKVTGVFSAGDPVDIVGPAGEHIARGLVSFDSDDLPAMLGRNTHELAAALGESFEREVVHRDVLMLTHPGADLLD